MKLNPKKGSIALCSCGYLGLITANGRTKITYSDGNSGEAYVGIHLTNQLEEIGAPWSSRNPKVICHVEDLEDAVCFSEFLVKASFYLSPDQFGEAYVVVADNSGMVSKFEVNATKVRLIPIREREHKYYEGEKNGNTEKVEDSKNYHKNLL